MGALGGRASAARIRLILAAASMLAGGAVTAHAAVDLNGPWRILAQTVPFFSPNVTCVVNVVQSGSSISVSGVGCAVPVNLAGTIDPDTGVLSASGASDPLLCPTLIVNATATPTSDAFSGTFNCNGIIPVSGPFSGGLCGNGAMNSGEDCDDGDVLDQDCCSPTCQFDPPSYGCYGDGTVCTADRCDGSGTCVSTPGPANERCERDSNSCTDDICDASGVCTHPILPAGSTCAIDFNVCTDDVCDAGGTCQPVNNTAACDDFNTCTVGDTCAAGACVPGTTFAPVGVRCDADANYCTVDACAVGGVCANVGCSLCCGGLGCTPELESTCTPPTEPSAKLQIKHREQDPSLDRLLWKGGHGGATSTADFGNPLTTTSYELCVYETGAAQLFLGYRAGVAAGGTCAGRPCWKATGSSGYSYRDPEHTPDGLELIRLKSGPAGTAGMLVKGKGSHLGLLRPDIQLTLPLTVQLKGSNGKCWSADFAQGRLTHTRLKAKDGQ